MSTATVISSVGQEAFLAALRGYLASSARTGDGASSVGDQVARDAQRVELIESTLKPLLREYLSGGSSLIDFRKTIDGINKRNQLWGFKGIKGQMFFNMLINSAISEQSCDAALKTALAAPENDETAILKLKDFREYLIDASEQLIASGGDPHARPRPSSIPFFVSYFWQIQDRDNWPVYYTTSVKVLAQLNLWQQTGEIEQDYSSYKSVHESLINLALRTLGKELSFYEVEHVFWYIANKEQPQANIAPTGAAQEDAADTPSSDREKFAALDDYVPPVVKIIPSLALNDLRLRASLKKAGANIERTFEKCCNAAFSILGYEANLLGQGKGRVPDGLADAAQESYAILWDAKARTDGYSMGTDDRTIQEYVRTQSNALKRKGNIYRNIYYVIISSSFTDDFDDLIHSLKMHTDVSEVCLLEAEALVAMVDFKLRMPFEASIGSEGLQRLFSSGGLITANDVRSHFE